MATTRTNTKANNKVMEAAMETNKRALAQNTINNAYSICGKMIASVPVELMDIDDSYQRVVSNNVKKLMQDWSDDKCNFLWVSYRDGKFYIIDGQHRWTVAKAKGIVTLPCIIFTGLTVEEEALKFADQNVNVKKLTAYDEYKAHIKNGDMSIPSVATDMYIGRVCDLYGVEVKKRSGVNREEKVLGSLTMARRIVNGIDGLETFDWIIGTVSSTNWRECGDSYSADMMGMFRTFYNNNKGCIGNATEVLKSVLNSISPTEFVINSKFEYKDYKPKKALTLYLNSLIEEKSKS